MSQIWVETQPSAQCTVPSPPYRKKALAVVVKKHAKVDIKLFLPCPVLLYFSILFQIFCPRLSEQTKFWS